VESSNSVVSTSDISEKMAEHPIFLFYHHHHWFLLEVKAMQVMQSNLYFGAHQTGFCYPEEVFFLIG
jgi:hypothetical protein